MTALSNHSGDRSCSTVVAGARLATVTGPVTSHTQPGIEAMTQQTILAVDNAAPMESRYLSPLLRSSVVIRIADIDRSALTSAGSCVLTQLRSIVLAARLTCNTIIWRGTWRRQYENGVFDAHLIATHRWSGGLITGTDHPPPETDRMTIG